jgi:hypothetical protein
MFVTCEIYDAVNKNTVCDWFGFSFDQNLGGNNATFINIFIHTFLFFQVLKVMDKINYKL